MEIELNPLIAYKDDPVNDTVHHPYCAYNQGYDASESEYSKSMNPYPEESLEWDYWNQGFDDYKIQDLIYNLNLN